MNTGNTIADAVNALVVELNRLRVDLLEAEQRPALRDLFAAAALMGLLADTQNDAGTDDDFAETSYRLADAMLRAREENGGE